MRHLTTKFPIIFFLLALVFITSCRKEEELFKSKPTEYFSAQVANDWLDMFRTLTKKTAGYTPPVAARSFGYAGVALYETVLPGMPQYQSLASQLTDMPVLAAPDLTQEYNWAIASNTAMAYLALNFYPTTPTEQVSAVLKLEIEHLDRLKVGVGQEVVNRSKEWGLTVAKAIFAWSKTDGGHEAYKNNFPTNYIPPVGMGFWVRTYPDFQSSLQPFWGNNRTFIPQCAQNTQPDPPAAFSEGANSVFMMQAQETYSATVNATPEQKIIAHYWSDDPGEPGTPPGHLVSITTQVLQKEKWNLAKAAETYARVGIGVSDAFVSCWKCKYQHNYIRPISFIRSKIDANWISILGTPPFPEYTSGHSVASGAISRILTDVFGSPYEITDKTHEKRTDIDGRPRTFRSFNDMAAEAAISRLYGGIHFREAISKGVDQGVRVGTEVGKLKFRK